MEKPFYETIEETKSAIIKMEKSRLVLYSNGMLSQKYNNILKKRILKLIKSNNINVAELISVIENKQ